MNFRTNYHSHNVFCDGRAPMEDFVKFAVAGGLKKYGFSSHAPLPFHTPWNMDLENLPYYKAEFNRLKEKYAEKIALSLGLEMDYIHGVFGARSNALYSTADLDYVISSVHYLDPLPAGGFFSVDGHFFDFEQGLKTIYNGNVRTAAERFFEISREMIKQGGFHIMGHVDKISQNASQCAGFNVSEKWYVQAVSDLLQLIKQEELILEINTKSYLEKGFTYPDVRFFPLIKELEIPIIVTSDCHYPHKVTDGFEHVYALLKEAGITKMMEFTQNEWRCFEFDF